jgi:membrane fusion protein, copper/silver efflux system
VTAASRRYLFGIAVAAAVVSAAGAATLKRNDDPPAQSRVEAAATPAAEEEEYWTCSMCPYVRQKEPGKCPSCGMKLIKKGGHTHAKEHKKGELTLSAERQQLIGVRTVEVEERELVKKLVAAGSIAPDETKIVELLANVSGTVEQVLGNPVGQQVRRGEPLFSVVTPEGTKALIRANATGHISWRVGFASTQVSPKLKVATIYDHAMMWVWVEVYETDIAMVRLNQSAVMSVPAYPGRTFKGKVAQIAPLLQSDTHTMKVRLDFANPEYLLKPGMSAVVEVEASLGTKLAIPEAAVIRTGTENVAFVSKGEGRFEVRDVELGAQVSGWYEVLGGLEAGEEIVAAANFLVDAESKLQGIRSSWQR